MKYKVENKVRIKSLDWYNENKDEFGNIDINEDFTFYADRSKYCGKVFTISEVFDNSYLVKEDNHEYYWSDEMIEGLVEEEKIEFTKEDKYWCDIMSESDPTTYVLPEGYIFKDENGNVINATKIVLEKKKPKYPKTYNECREIMGVDTGFLFTSYDLDLWKGHLLSSLQKLLICLYAYWKIAGEEMGLGKPWEPDFDNEYEYKYGLFRLRNTIYKDATCINPTLLIFPTAEMRDAFYENFKKLIESCKELL